MGGRQIFAAALLATAFCSANIHAAEIHGRSSTQLSWFNNYINDHRQVELAEYLRMSVTNLDKEGKASLHGYGRLTQDLNNGEGSTSRLYYLYGEYRDLYDKLDFRLGRQFVNTAAGTSIIDGGQVDLKNVGPVAFSAFAGRDVLFDSEDEVSQGGDMAFGVAAYLAGFKNTDLELSWYRKLDDWYIARDILGASFKQYLFNSLRLYGNTRFDVVAETFNEVLVGVKYYPLASLVLTGEWYQSYPTFDTTSIYSVFAVDRYQEAVFRADYTINDKITVNGGYTFQIFEGGDNGHIYQLGCSLRPIEPVQLVLQYDNNQGYNGTTHGIIADIYYDVTKAIQLAGGMVYDVYDRESMEGDEIARLYWAGGKYRLAKNMAASLRVENNVNAQYSSDVQGRFVFDYDF